MLTHHFVGDEFHRRVADDLHSVDAREAVGLAKPRARFRLEANRRVPAQGQYLKAQITGQDFRGTTPAAKIEHVTAVELIVD